MMPRVDRMARFACTCAALSALAQPAMGASAGSYGATTAASASVDAPKVKKPSENFPLTGSFDTLVSADGGTFVAGEQQRPGADFIMIAGAAYKASDAISLSVKQRVDKNLISNSDSSWVRPYYTTVYDTSLSGTFVPQQLNAAGASEARKFGGFGLSLGLGLDLPTSKAADLTSRYCRVGITGKVSRKVGKFSFSWSSNFSKFFNKYQNVVYRENPAALPPARMGGAEDQGPDGVLGATTNNSFYFRQVLAGEAALTDKLNLSATYHLFNFFTYADHPIDEYSSPYARSGRGRSDTQWGVISLGYDLDDHNSVSVSTFTAGPVFSADNKTYRFPFWDFRSLSDNYSSASVGYSYAF
jgi:hypothetical protein